jgi:Na+/proline symporter
MMLCQKILPAGLIGLVLAGMISATSSKANTTINLAATVFATDLYKNLVRTSASEKEQILVARIFTLLFGAGTVGIALLVPHIGGIVDFVLSTAAIAGGALFAPIIWSLFSKRQTGFSVVTTTLLTLAINLFLKILAPSLLELKLSRTMEIVVGQSVPLITLFCFELFDVGKDLRRHFKDPQGNGIRSQSTEQFWYQGDRHIHGPGWIRDPATRFLFREFKSCGHSGKRHCLSRHFYFQDRKQARFENFLK